MRGNEDEQRTGREVSLLRPNTRLNAPYKCPTPRESDWRADPHRRSRNQVKFEWVGVAMASMPVETDPERRRPQGNQITCTCVIQSIDPSTHYK